jgi:hypothetical protein
MFASKQFLPLPCSSVFIKKLYKNRTTLFLMGKILEKVFLQKRLIEKRLAGSASENGSDIKGQLGLGKHLL